ncbi:hypothetical protein RYX36_002873 [Vicia faba]
MASSPVCQLLSLTIVIMLTMNVKGQGGSTSSSTSWCVVRSDASYNVLQTALDYACGSGADCLPLQPDELCFLPNTIQAHASYAFNSYYQKELEHLVLVTFLEPPPLLKQIQVMDLVCTLLLQVVLEDQIHQPRHHPPTSSSTKLPLPNIPFIKLQSMTTISTPPATDPTTSVAAALVTQPPSLSQTLTHSTITAAICNIVETPPLYSPLSHIKPKLQSPRLSLTSRLPAELGSLESMLPLYSAVASARLVSSLSIESLAWGLVLQVIPYPQFQRTTFKNIKFKKYNPELKSEEIEGRRRSGIITRTNSRIRVAFLHVNFFIDFCAGNESTFEATSPTEKTTAAPSIPDRS